MLSVTSAEEVACEPSAFSNESTKLALRPSSLSSTLTDDSPVKNLMLCQS